MAILLTRAACKEVSGRWPRRCPSEMSLFVRKQCQFCSQGLYCSAQVCEISREMI